MENKYLSSLDSISSTEIEESISDKHENVIFATSDYPKSTSLNTEDHKDFDDNDLKKYNPPRKITVNRYILKK